MPDDELDLDAALDALDLDTNFLDSNSLGEDNDDDGSSIIAFLLAWLLCFGSETPTSYPRSKLAGANTTRIMTSMQEFYI